MITLTPVLSAHWDEKDSFTLAGYKRHGGYEAASKALKMEPDAVIQLVKDSGLRGRGGAGFPTGMKWGFIPQGDGKEHYLVVNADESEPGTCKDMPLLLANPHVLIEGIIIASYAIRAKRAFIYVRGEATHVVRRVQQAIEDASKAGYLGKNIFDSGVDLEVVLHVGAGAYICGEDRVFAHHFQRSPGYMPAPLSLIMSNPLLRSRPLFLRVPNGSPRWVPKKVRA
jgi:NADH-quinone oxidoreductase subunit F